MKHLSVALTLALLVLTVGSAFSVNAGAPVNRVVLDLTYEKSTGRFSMGGFTYEQLAQLGIQPFDSRYLAYLQSLGDVDLMLNATGVDLEIDGSELAYVEWDPQSRLAMFDLASHYGLRLPAATLSRAEGWIGVLDVEVTVRETAEVSQPLMVQLDSPFQVDVDDEGNLSVEGMYTGMKNLPLAHYADLGQIETATTCWKEGVLNTTVNGARLPTVTIHKEGAALLDKALGLGIGNNTEQFFQSRAGVDLAFNGSGHSESATCVGK